MSLTITQEIKQTFHLVALRNEAKDLVTGRQWEKRDGLINRCEQARRKETALFDARFDARIAIEQKKLIDKAGSKQKVHKPIWGQDDVFDKTANLAQADKNVRSAHDRRVEIINQYEKRGLEALVQSARSENKTQGKSERSLNQAADRRLGGERRIRKLGKQSRKQQR